MKEGAGPPKKDGLYVLYILNGDGYVSTLGNLCEHDYRYLHTTMGTIETIHVVAHIGPLPDPGEIFGRVSN